MDQDTPSTRDLARLVLSDEPPSDSAQAVHAEFEKLRSHLSTRLGSGGYRALLGRARALAVSDLPWLAPVRIADDGALDGFQDITGSQDLMDGSVTLLSRLIELLDTFIGRRLTLRVLRSAWPHALPGDDAARPGEVNG
jgi:hypothetical protein